MAPNRIPTPAEVFPPQAKAPGEAATLPITPAGMPEATAVDTPNSLAGLLRLDEAGRPVTPEGERLNANELLMIADHGDEIRSWMASNADKSVASTAEPPSPQETFTARGGTEEDWATLSPKQQRLYEELASQPSRQGLLPSLGFSVEAWDRLSPAEQAERIRRNFIRNPHLLKDKLEGFNAKKKVDTESLKGVLSVDKNGRARYDKGQRSLKTDENGAVELEDKRWWRKQRPLTDTEGIGGRFMSDYELREIAEHADQIRRGLPERNKSGKAQVRLGRAAVRSVVGEADSILESLYSGKEARKATRATKTEKRQAAKLEKLLGQYETLVGEPTSKRIESEIARIGAEIDYAQNSLGSRGKEIVAELGEAYTKRQQELGGTVPGETVEEHRARMSALRKKVTAPVSRAALTAVGATREFGTRLHRAARAGIDAGIAEMTARAENSADDEDTTK